MENPSNLRLPFCRSLFFGTLLCALPSTGADARSPEQIPTLGYALHRLGPLGSNGWGQTDVDGDGRADLVTGSDGAAAMILVFGAMEQSSLPGMKQSLFNPPGSIAALATASAGVTRVVTVSPGGLATRYGGWPLGPLGSFNVATGTRVARIADIDADGALELVCAGPGQIGAYTLSSGESEWTLPLSVADLAIEQLDADPALELIIAGGDTNPAYVVDGATRTLEWSRPEGIGTFVAAGRLGNFLEPVIVGARAWNSLSGFSVAPFGLAWTMTNFNTDAVTTGDADGDGRDEFAVGDGQWGSIRVYDGPSRQLRHQIGNSGHGVLALAMVDFNADARDEVFYSARIEASSNRDANFAAAIVDPITSRVRLTIESYWQGATATALADLDGNGSLEWVVGTSHPFANKGLLRKFDAATGAEIWRAPYESANSFLPFQMGYNGLHVAQLDADAAMELLAVGGNRDDDFRFLIIDGATRTVQRQFPEPITPIFSTVTGSRLVQHVAGGNPELLVAQHLFNSSANVRLEVYSLPSGQLAWASPRVGGPMDQSRGLDVGQLDADPSPEYLLVHSRGLSAYDAGSGESEWFVPTQSNGAVIISTQAGPGFLTFTTQGDVTRYRTSPLQPSGSFSLSAPLERLVRVPMRDDLLLAVAGERLQLVDLDGRVLKESGWIGGSPGIGENLHVVPDGEGWLISVGRSFGTFRLRLDDPEFLFTDGFE